MTTLQKRSVEANLQILQSLKKVAKSEWLKYLSMNITERVYYKQENAGYLWYISVPVELMN